MRLLLCFFACYRAKSSMGMRRLLRLLERNRGKASTLGGGGVCVKLVLGGILGGGCHVNYQFLYLVCINLWSVGDYGGPARK